MSGGARMVESFSRVGNDVVDLDDPALALTHPRFAERVCSESERARVAALPDPRRLLFTFFAAKEAAFKLVSKRGRVPVFAHRRFETAIDLRSIRYDGLEMPLRVEYGEGYVHAVAGTPASLAIVGPVPAGAPPSEAVRGLVAQVLAPILGVGMNDVAVERHPHPDTYDGLGPPCLVVSGVPSPIDVSLSHDGRFVAFAVAPRPKPWQLSAPRRSEGGSFGLAPTEPDPATSPLGSNGTKLK